MKAIQNFCAEIFAEFYDGGIEYLPSPDREKVKWGNVEGKDVKKFEEKVEEFSCDKVLIGKRINLEYPDIILYNPRDIIELIKEHQNPDNYRFNITIHLRYLPNL